MQTGSKLKWTRELKGLSQRELAELSGVTKRMIECYEQGTRDINLASAAAVYKLATALGVPMESLLNV